jgi:flavodoxin
MRALVIYESKCGNTHLIARSIAESLRAHAETFVAPVGEADATLVGGADLIVVGGPTHAHGVSRASTRKGVVTLTEKPGSTVTLDRDSAGLGLREWFSALGQVTTAAAAFDTRFDLPAAFTGRASRGIARKLRRHGATLISDPESFFVTNDNRLEPGEECRARVWGAHLGFLLDGIALRRITRS